MAAIFSGFSVNGYERLVRDFLILSSVAFSINGLNLEPKVRLGTLNFCWDFGGTDEDNYYLLEERTIWTRPLVWRPPSNTPLGIRWQVYADWKLADLDWVILIDQF